MVAALICDGLSISSRMLANYSSTGAGAKLALTAAGSRRRPAKGDHVRHDVADQGDRRSEDQRNVKPRRSETAGDQNRPGNIAGTIEAVARATGYPRVCLTRTGAPLQARSADGGEAPLGRWASKRSCMYASCSGIWVIECDHIESLAREVENPAGLPTLEAEAAVVKSTAGRRRSARHDEPNFVHPNHPPMSMHMRA